MPVAFQASTLLPEDLHIATQIPDGEGYTQVWVERRDTGRRYPVSAAGSNNTSPRITVDGVVLYQTDRGAMPRGAVPSGLMWSPLDRAEEHPVLPYPTDVLFGDSTVEQFPPAYLTWLTGRPCLIFGKSGTTALSAAIRQGGLAQSYQPVTGILPADMTPVVMLPAEPGPNDAFARLPRSICGTFLGVRGTLAWDGIQNTFQRDVPGAALALDFPVPFVADQITSVGLICAPDHTDCHLIIRTDRNDPRISAVIPPLQAMVAGLTTRSKRFLALPINNNANEIRGTAAYSNIMAVNAAIEMAFQDNYPRVNGLDLRQYLISQYDINQEQDIIDHNNDVVPTSLCSDGLHENKTGKQHVAHFLATALYQRRWVDWIPPGDLLTAPDRAFTSWFTMAVSVAYNTGNIATDGVSRPIKLTPTTASGYHYLDLMLPTVSSGSTARVAVFLKAVGITQAELALLTPSTNGVVAMTGINLTTGTFSPAYAANGSCLVLGDVIDCGGGWYLAVVVGSHADATDYVLRLVVGSGPYVGDGASGVLAYAPSFLVACHHDDRVAEIQMPTPILAL